MDTKELQDFTNTTIETYKKMNGGERKRFRELLKRHDTYIRHVQRFNQKGADLQYAILRNDTSDNGTGTNSNPQTVDAGESGDVSGTDKPNEGTVCAGTQQDGQECVSGERQEAQT